MNDAKNPFASKTVWLNVITTAIALVTAAGNQEWIAANPLATAIIVAVLGMLNVALRFVTTAPISFAVLLLVCVLSSISSARELVIIDAQSTPVASVGPVRRVGACIRAKILRRRCDVRGVLGPASNRENAPPSHSPKNTADFCATVATVYPDVRLASTFVEVAGPRRPLLDALFRRGVITVTKPVPKPEPAPKPLPTPLPPIDANVVGQMLELHNGLRVAEGRKPLVVSVALNNAAQGYADTMARMNLTFQEFGTRGHTADGTTFVDRALAAGYPKPAGENIAAGYTTAKQAFGGWSSSPPHRANILGAGNRAVGFGRATGANMSYWCTVFGS